MQQVSCKMAQCRCSWQACRQGGLLLSLNQASAARLCPGPRPPVRPHFAHPHLRVRHHAAGLGGHAQRIFQLRTRALQQRWSPGAAAEWRSRHAKLWQYVPNSGKSLGCPGFWQAQDVRRPFSCPHTHLHVPLLEQQPAVVGVGPVLRGPPPQSSLAQDALVLRGAAMIGGGLPGVRRLLPAVYGLRPEERCPCGALSPSRCRCLMCPAGKLNCAYSSPTCAMAAPLSPRSSATWGREGGSTSELLLPVPSHSRLSTLGTKSHPSAHLKSKQQQHWEHWTAQASNLVQGVTPPTSAMPRSACWWMDTGAEPLISPNAASPSVTQPVAGVVEV